MQVNETLSEGLKRAYTVAIPAADIDSKRAARMAEIGKTVRLPGFRPGKVPANLMRQRYGAAVFSEVMQEAVQDAWQRVLSDRGLRAAEQPRLAIADAAEGKDLTFTVEVELLPEIEMPDFASISLTRPKAAPNDESVETMLSQVAKRQAEPVEAEAGAAAAVGDTLTVDYRGTVDGVAFDGGAGTDMKVEVGGSGFIPGFTEQMEGMKVGETRTIDVTFPEGYQAAELAGKPAQFEITAKALHRPAVPALDDELAKKLGFDDLGKLRDALVEQMQREFDGLSRMKVKRQLLDALSERARFDVPESMVQREFDAIWRRVEADQKAGRLDEDDKGKDEATLRFEYRAIAERRVRLGLLLSEISRVNNIQVSQEDLNRALWAEVSRYPGHEEAMLDLYRKNPQALERLRGPLLEDKVVDYMIDLASVEDKAVTPEELAEEAGEGAKAA